MLVVGCATGSVYTKPKYELSVPEFHAKLANGMRVILLPDLTTELVEVDVRYDVGANEDPPGKAGLAHLVEHLMFDQRPAGPDKPTLGAVLRAHSLYYNAYTSGDSTHYQILSRADELANLIGLEATRQSTGCQTIDQVAFEREREVVRNEIRQRSGTAEEQVMARVLEAIYPEGHPYRHPVGGDDSQLVAITLEDVCRFMDGYYVPERSIVILAGAVTQKSAAPAVDEYLASLPPRPGAKRADVPLPVLTQKMITIEADVEEPTVYVAWALPRPYTREQAAIGHIIGSITGRTAALGQRYELASSVRPHILGGVRAPVLALEVRLREADQVNEALDLIWKNASVANWHMGNDEDYKKTQARILGSLTMDFEPLEARANLFGDLAQFDPSDRYFAGEIARASALTRDEAKTIIGQVLDRDKATVVLVKPTHGAGLYRRAAGGFSANDHAADEDFPVERSEAAVPIVVPQNLGPLMGAKRFELPNGLKVVLLATDAAVPVITAELVFGAGRAHEDAAVAGVAHVAAASIDPPMATGRIQWMDGLDGFAMFGIEAGSAVTSDHTLFLVRGLSIYQNLILEGLERMIKTASYRPDLDGGKKLEEIALRRRSVRADRALAARMNESLFGKDHPYARSAVPTPKTLGAIGYDAVRSFALKHYVAANATLVVTGKLDLAAAEKDISEKFSEWTAGAADPVISEAPVKRNEPSYVAVEGEDSPLIQLRVAYPAPGGRGPEYAARLVLAQMLLQRVGSVREKLGASYGVYARLDRRVGPSSYQVAGSIDAERGGEALTAIRHAIDGLRGGQGFLEDFVRARRRVLEQLLSKASDSMSLAQDLVDMAEYNLPVTAADDLRRSVGALTPQQVVKLVNTELRPDGEVIIAVGPRAKVKKMYEGAGLKGVVYEK